MFVITSRGQVVERTAGGRWRHAGWVCDAVVSLAPYRLDDGTPGRLALREYPHRRALSGMTDLADVIGQLRQESGDVPATPAGEPAARTGNA